MKMMIDPVWLAYIHESQAYHASIATYEWDTKAKLDF